MKTKRIIFSILGGVALLVLFLSATWLLSDQFAAEGADTPAARQIALTYSWIFPVAHSMNLHGLLAVPFIFGVPIAVYSVIIFVLSSCYTRVRDASRASGKQSFRSTVFMNHD